jgi:hypothetical protein
MKEVPRTRNNKMEAPSEIKKIKKNERKVIEMKNNKIKVTGIKK